MVLDILDCWDVIDSVRGMTWTGAIIENRFVTKRSFFCSSSERLERGADVVAY